MSALARGPTYAQLVLESWRCRRLPPTAGAATASTPQGMGGAGQLLM
jgi:hypothetical protein